MNKSNYYLSLLYKKIKELKKVLEELASSDCSNEYKKYLISGYIITFDSILEIGIGDLHSPLIDELSSLIYYTRQKAVHYGYFNGITNIEDTAQKIIDLTDTHYEKEQEFYNEVFNLDFFDECNNVLIKKSSKIENDTYFYKFKSLDESQVLCVPTRRVFKLTQKSKDKVSGYIVDTTNPVGIYFYDKNGVNDYKEVCDEEMKEFFRKNYFVTNENYNDHNIVMRNIIDSFVTNPVNSIQIMEYASDGQFCKNTIDIIKDFIIDNCMYEGYIKNNHLIKDKYSLNKMQKTDYTKLQHSFRKNINTFMNTSDAFFVSMTLKRANYYFNILNNAESEDNFKPEILAPMLIQLFEVGPKHFSNKFINSSPEFKKCYGNLLRYRQIFSHYILLGKEYSDGLDKFKKDFLNFISLLQSIDLTKEFSPTQEEYGTYNIIERDKSDFFNYKHEQFLRVKKNTYIGKKIHYSSHRPNSKSLIAILPGGNSAANTSYYQRDIDGYLTPQYTIDEATGKKHYINASTNPLKHAKEVKIDFNLANLFKAYNALNKLKQKSDILIYFAPCEDNGNASHYDDLETVIMRFFSQGYLPIELLQKTKIDCSRLSKGVIVLTDYNNTPIATIVNKQKCNLEPTYKKDDKRFFSRIDDITHDFSKRRHGK